MEVINKDQEVFVAFKLSYGYHSGGYEGPLYFSTKSNTTVDGGKNKGSKVLFLDKQSAENFKKNFEDYYKEHGTGWTHVECRIKSTKDNPRLERSVFGNLNDITVEEKNTKYGKAYGIILED